MLIGNLRKFKLPYFQSAHTSHLLLLRAKQLYYHPLERLAGLPYRIHWIYSDFRRNYTSHMLALTSSYFKTMTLACGRLAGAVKRSYNTYSTNVKIFVYFQLLEFFCREINISGRTNFKVLKPQRYDPQTIISNTKKCLE